MRLQCDPVAQWSKLSATVESMSSNPSIAADIFDFFVKFLLSETQSKAVTISNGLHTVVCPKDGRNSLSLHVKLFNVLRSVVIENAVGSGFYTGGRNMPHRASRLAAEYSQRLQA